MTPDAAVRFLDNVFLESCKAVLGLQGNLVSDVELNEFDFNGVPAACIDGGTNDFEMVLTLNMPYSTLAMTFPKYAMGSTGEEQLEDWIGELTNLTLGHFNQVMDNVGYYLSVGLPDRVVGEEFIHVLPKGSRTFRHCMAVDGEPFMASLQVELLNKDFKLDLHSGSSLYVDPGDIELF